MRGKCAFKESDLRRAERTLVAAGQPVAGVRFYPDGGFTVLTGNPGDATELERNDLDKWMAKHNAN